MTLKKLMIVFLTVLFISMTGCSLYTLFLMDKKHQLFASPKPYPPYIYINDFAQFYAMGLLAKSEEASRLYDGSVQDKYMNRVLAPLHTQKIYYAQNVPWLFCLMIPLTLMNLKTAFIVFSATGVSLGIAALLLIARRFRRIKLSIATAIIFGILASESSWMTLNHGNTGWFLIAAIGLYFYALLAKRDLLGGCGLAIAAQKPQYALLLAIPAFRYKRWRLIIAALIFEAILWVGAGAIVGSSNVVGYPQMLLSADANSNYDGIYPRLQVNLRAFYSCYLGDAICMPASLVSFALGALLLFWFWIKFVPEKNELLQRWGLALTLCIALVISPHTYPYDLVLFALPAVLTLPLDRLAERPVPERVALRFWITLLAGYPILSWLLYLGETGTSFQNAPLAYLNIAMSLAVTAAFVAVYRSSPEAPSS